MKKRSSSSASLILRVVIILVAVFLTVAIFSGPYQSSSSLTCSGQETSREVFAKILPTVVAIHSSGDFLGSGVLIDRRTVLTSAHILTGSDPFFVTQDTKQVLGSSFVKHPQKDLALVFLAEDFSGSFASVVSSQVSLFPGERVFGFGSMDDIVLGHEGLLSSLSSRVSFGGQSYFDLLLSDISLQAGYSGGPLVNTSGEVIGIHTVFQAGVPGSWSTPVDTHTLAEMLAKKTQTK